MENNIIWIKEDKTNNIYCCELGKACIVQTEILYEIISIIGCANYITIPRCRTFKNPVPCVIFKPTKTLDNCSYIRGCSTGLACFDIEKLK